MFMKSTLLVFSLLLVSNKADKNPDLEIRIRSDSDVAIVKNLSAAKVYTATIRRREFRKQYRVYRIGDLPGDTVVLKRDTLVQFAKVVVPPGKWRYLGVTFKGETTLMIDQRMMVDTGYVSTVRFRIMDSIIGGDVTQVFRKPEPFAKKQPFNIFPVSNSRFYSTYQGTVNRK